jgi:hypothetical protein
LEDIPVDVLDDDAADRGIRADDKVCIVVPPGTDR